MRILSAGRLRYIPVTIVILISTNQFTNKANKVKNYKMRSISELDLTSINMRDRFLTVRGEEGKS